MTDQLELIGGDLPAEFEGLREVAQFQDRAPDPALHAAREWLAGQLGAYVGAIYTMRPRYSEAEHLEERARLIRSGWQPTPSRESSDVEQLEDEAALRRHRGNLARDRAAKILTAIAEAMVSGELPVDNPRVVNTEQRLSHNSG